MVYHPGRVLKVFAAQTKAGETAATRRFWDNNLHTVKVSKDIARSKVLAVSLWADPSCQDASTDPGI